MGVLEIRIRNTACQKLNQVGTSLLHGTVHLMGTGFTLEIAGTIIIIFFLKKYLQ